MDYYFVLLRSRTRTVTFALCLVPITSTIRWTLTKLMEMDEASDPDNSWYGTPRATILPSKRKRDEDEASPHEETLPRRDKEKQKRRRMEAKAAKRRKSMAMIAHEKMEVSKPEVPLSAMSVQKDGPQLPENASSPPTIISRSSSHEPSPSEGSVDIQAGFRAEGVSMRLSSSFEVKFI